MKIGTKLSAFALLGTDGKRHSTKDYKNIPLVVIITCNHCPHALAYVGRIRNLYKKYHKKAGFFAVNSNDATRYPQDSFEHMKPMAESLGIGGSYLHDESQDVARSLGARRTPEVFVFDQEGTLVYTGAIDDNEADPQLVNESYLDDAIAATLVGGDIPVPVTQAIGCSIKWKE